MKTALILGASSDIGLATVNLFLKNGWTVYYHYNSSKKKKLKNNKNLKYLKLNFLDSEKKIDYKLKYLSRIKFDSVINLVGYIDNKSFKNFKIDDLLKSIRVNSIVPFFIIKKIVPNMVKKKFGRILQTSSIGVKFGGGENSFNYSLSKKINEFIPSNIKKLASKNILMNTLVIGVTNTKIHKKIKSKDLNKRKKLIPIKRFAETYEIARYIYFLSSDNNSYITGQKINISGGE
jgi:3-oxoacyl-[acyl-carrier protein] reductase